MFWNRSKVPVVKADELKDLMEQKQKITILDVRTPPEWKQSGVIPGSILVPTYKVMQELDKGLKLQNGKKVVVVCRSGNRSKNITKKLRELDIDAYNLKSGINSWIDNGFKVEQY